MPSPGRDEFASSLGSRRLPAKRHGTQGDLGRICVALLDVEHTDPIAFRRKTTCTEAVIFNLHPEPIANSLDARFD